MQSKFKLNEYNFPTFPYERRKKMLPKIQSRIIIVDSPILNFYANFHVSKNVKCCG